MEIKCWKLSPPVGLTYWQNRMGEWNLAPTQQPEDTADTRHFNSRSIPALFSKWRLGTFRLLLYSVQPFYIIPHYKGNALLQLKLRIFALCELSMNKLSLTLDFLIQSLSPHKSESDLWVDVKIRLWMVLYLHSFTLNLHIYVIYISIN